MASALALVLCAVRFTVRLCLLLLLILFGLLPTIVTFNRFGRSITVGNGSLEEFMLNGWSRSLCRIFGVRLDVSGQAGPGPVLVVANHISWLDIKVLHGVAAMGFVGKAEIKNWPLLGFLATIAGTVFHQRGCKDSASDVASAMVERLNQGRRVAIFPEGGILPGPSVKRFHARLFKAAIEAECPVQPVMIRYMRDGVRDDDVTFRRGEHFLGNLIRLLGRAGSTAEVRFLDLLDSAGKQRRELADEAHRRVVESFEEQAVNT